MNYLEQVLAQTANHNIAVKRSRLATDSLMQALQPPAAAPVAPQGVAQAASRRVGSSGGGPHTAGDGHNHGSGGQSVGEANELWRRLQTMLKDRPTIKPGARSRSYATQVKLWNDYKAGRGAMAARPGTSKHGNGRANDLKYGSEADRQWALQNAGKYGLAFPLYNPKLGRGRDESWHIELKR